jgi:hypothetical protein
MDEKQRAALVEAQAALQHANAVIRGVLQDAEEDAADLAIGLQRLDEIRKDPSLIITGEALEKRLAALR